MTNEEFNTLKECIAEMRNFALLQAAVQMLSMYRGYTRQEAVDAAKDLLRRIEE